MSHHRIPFTDEQLWQAFQYVSGELCAEECETFERQLQDSAGLCEAVAEVVLLTSEIAACGQSRSIVPSASLEASQQARSTARKNRAVAALTAICCCLGLVLILSQGPIATDSAVDVVSGQETIDAEYLVTAWAVSSAPEVVASEFYESGETELDVPDWMLAAVTLSEMAEGVDSDTPADSVMPDDMELF
jgi:hypothetical protein